MEKNSFCKPVTATTWEMAIHLTGALPQPARSYSSSTNCKNWSVCSDLNLPFVVPAILLTAFNCETYCRFSTAWIEHSYTKIVSSLRQSLGHVETTVVHGVSRQPLPHIHGNSDHSVIFG